MIRGVCLCGHKPKIYFKQLAISIWLKIDSMWYESAAAHGVWEQVGKRFAKLHRTFPYLNKFSNFVLHPIEGEQLWFV